MQEREQLDILLEHKSFLEKRFGAGCIVLENVKRLKYHRPRQEAIRAGIDTGMVPAGVMDYIRVNDLYAGNGCDSKNTVETAFRNQKSFRYQRF